MSITDTIEDVIIAKWRPGDWFSIEDIIHIASRVHVTSARSTIQRTMQEVRDRGTISFGDPRGNYLRKPVRGEIEDNIRSEVISSLASRKNGTPIVRKLTDEKLTQIQEDIMASIPPVDKDISTLLSSPAETEALSQVKVRIGQGLFRKRLIERNPICALTGCSLLPILRASHIKPWRFCDSDERLDTMNGFLFVPTVDALFDVGLISCMHDGELLISPLLKYHLELLPMLKSRRIQTVSGQELYLLFHRTRVFMGITGNQ